jgi:DNA-binding SARP family transcriptional activator
MTADGPVLSWCDDDGGDHRLALTAEAGQVTIGRRKDSAVPLTWDAEVSRAHAQLEPLGPDWTIRDDGLSRNGTWVNGERLRGRRRLFDGDTILVGRTLLAVTMYTPAGALTTAGATEARSAAPAGTVVRLCGPLAVERAGERVEGLLRQGRLVLAYLALRPGRSARRDQLIDALWAEELPKRPEANLNTILTRLRDVLGDDALTGREPVTLQLGPDPFVDVEAAERRVDDAGRALAAGAPGRAVAAAREAAEILSRPLLPEFDALPWVAECQSDLDRLRLAALRTHARAARRIGGAELAGAEAAARELVRLEPWDESGYAELMRVLVAAGDRAGALRVLDELRVKLREVGMAPSATTLAIV